jgi:molybdopterin converting factor small subunit
MTAARDITVHVPTPLRKYCDGASDVTVVGASLREALREIERRFRDLYGSVCDETGAIRRHVNIFVNGANVKDGKGLDTPLAPGDAVMILPAVSGGSTWAIA